MNSAQIYDSSFFNSGFFQPLGFFNIYNYFQISLYPCAAELMTVPITEIKAMIDPTTAEV
jgi:hypothetical protein